MSQPLFPGFDRLSHSIHLQEDRSSSPSIQPIHDQVPPPDFVFLFSWVEARPQHILKYVKGYSELFPKAKVMILTTSLRDMIVQSFVAGQSHLAAALQIVESKPNAKVLVHAFSNGGAYRVTQFHLEYAKYFSKRFNPRTIILDSTPGKGTFRRTVAAIMFSLPKQRFARVLSLLAAYVALALLWTAQAVFRRDNIVTKIRERLNDPQLMSSTCPRIYLYSKADEMVWWEDVEEHAAKARQRGWQVNCVRFTSSSHVNHPKEDATRYWNAVKAAWDASNQESRLSS